jgi:DNA-binding winged helix-turn-helix (wHTH) protein
MATSTEERKFERYSFGRFVLDTRGVMWRDGELFQEIRHKDFEILSFLLRRAGEPVTIDEIIRNVWPDDEETVEDNNVVGRIGKIRRIIGDNPQKPTYIKTIRHGYFFDKATLAPPPLPALPQVEVSFSKLDTVHVHVDGGSGEAPVSEIVARFVGEGRPSRMNSVMDFTDGPQREEDPATYASHTPGGIDDEKLEFFSTHLFGGFAETKRGLHRLLSRLEETRSEGMVVEAERIIGNLSDDSNEWSDTYINHYPVLCSGDVGYTISKTKPIEIHYALDIPRQGEWLNAPPLGLRDLTLLSSELGIRVGGWFLFDKREQNKWAYRSNMFEREARREEIEEYRVKLRDKLIEVGSARGFTCEVRALVEQTIGIWNTPLKVFTGPRNVVELSEWERNYPDLKDFWVVTPNFLGDKEQYIRNAMLSNLRNRSVTYTYFLRSIADYNRLLSLAEGLQRQLPDYVNVYDRIRAVMIIKSASDARTVERLFEQGQGQGCFIANPVPHESRDDDMDGYMLVRSSEDLGQISGGRVMKHEQLKGIVELLKPLLPSGRPLQGYSLPLNPLENREMSGTTIVCVGLKSLPQLLNDVDEESVARLLREYDLLVSSEVSKLGGEVVRSIESGYLLKFEKQNAAFLCAEQIKKGAESIDPTLAQKIAIDYGDVWRVMRAHGFDYCGKAITRCRGLLKKARYGEMWTTNEYATTLGQKHSARLVLTDEVFRFENSETKIWKLSG